MSEKYKSLSHPKVRKAFIIYCIYFDEYMQTHFPSGQPIEPIIAHNKIFIDIIFIIISNLLGTKIMILA